MLNARHCQPPDSGPLHFSHRGPPDPPAYDALIAAGVRYCERMPWFVHMPKVISFDDALKAVGGKDCSLLLGNGFSASRQPQDRVQG
jgi:hypothetical protein